ncbi:MAG: hypothetical protein HZA93_13185 [Verrucomicrobia bacterium]|nr:hypothetical protein [Verrucomicrobiota bacterium]
MKTKHLASLLCLFACTAPAQVTSYQPPSIQSITQVSKSGGSAGTTLSLTVTIARGTDPSPSIVGLSYEFGQNSISASEFPQGRTVIPVAIEIKTTSVVGAYLLDHISITHSAGITSYWRDGSITHLGYPAAGLPTRHSFNLAAGDFSVVAPGTQVPTTPPVVTQFTGRAINLSTRGFVGTGDQVMIVGIVVASGTKSFLFRAVGPGLGALGLSGFVRDPKIELKDQTGATIAENDNWSSQLLGDMQSVGAFGLSTASKDAALKATLAAGNYTLTISSADGSTGIAIAEAYELP